MILQDGVEQALTADDQGGGFVVGVAVGGAVAVVVLAVLVWRLRGRCGETVQRKSPTTDL